jgi:hypothetical protein
MAPRWPQVNNGPENINEHAAYLKEVCNQLQAADKGRTNQIPWNTVQPYILSTLALIGKVLAQPSVGEVLHQIRDAAKDIQIIQRDMTAVKGSIGLGTTPLNLANFSGVRAAKTSWAQVAAMPRGPLMPPPEPVQHGTHATKTSIMVTAYKDRVVTVRLKDRNLARRYRNNSPTWARQQIQNSIRGKALTKSIKVVAAHQLKSGDIQIYTSTTAETRQLKENQAWVKGLGEHAELVVPTYGVIVHGVSTKSINIQDQDTVIRQMLADNYTVVPQAKISYVGWLTKEGNLKRTSSIVVEFTDPEMANAIIYAGMAWDGQIHQCQLYDRACRVKQCFRCYHYGHIGTQCNASQTCGYCAELHESKHCPQKSMSGFTPRCTVCKGDHTAWSNVCPARKKELGRVGQAKQTRSVYWHVPAKSTVPPTNIDNTAPASTTQETILSMDPIPDTEIPNPVTATRDPEEDEDTIVVQAGRPTVLPPNTASETVPTQSHVEVQGSRETMTIQTTDVPARTVPSTGPTTEQESLQPLWQPPIDPQLNQTSSIYPELEETAEIQDAEGWLDSMFNEEQDSEWLPDIAEASPLTSTATEGRAAAGMIHRGCKCPDHQHIYDTWPTSDAELTIAKCMTVCVYCGVDYGRPPTLRMHLRSAKHARNNISVVRETKGKGSSTTPSWIRTPRPDNSQHG